MTKTRHDSEILAQGQQVITACAFIHHSFDHTEKVFLPKRAANKKFLPGIFELPGGHIDFGEDMVSGLKREILEEFGMKVRVGDPFHIFTYMNDVKRSHSIEALYFATFIDPLEKIKLDSEDHSEYGWFGEFELENVTNDVKRKYDPEIKAIIKGFSLLKGAGLNLGY